MTQPASASASPPVPVRVWDLPTRLFHWGLAASVVALFITAKVGGNAMTWHLRLGYVVLALLLFRVVWGVVGGRWSRFASFFYGPGRVLRYLRGQGEAQEHAGHNPLGALSVFALLGALLAQVLTGLMADDEIAFSGPLTRFVSGDTVAWATSLHTDVGQWLLVALVALHLAAIAFYTHIKRHSLVRPMVLGDKQLPASTPASRDDARTRLLAAVVLAAAAAVAWWVAQLGVF